MPASYQDSDYAAAAGIIWAVEKRLLNTAALERILDAASVDDALRLLTQISEYDFGALQHTADYEGVLKHELKRVYALLYDLSPDPDVAGIPGLKYDYHNVKVCVKAQHAGLDAAHLLYDVTRTSPLAVDRAVLSGDLGDVSKHLAEAITRAKAAYEGTGAPGSPGDIDLALDRLMFAEMAERADRLGCPFIIEYVQKAVDFHNLKTLFRVRAIGGDARLLKSALADGGSLPPEYFEDAYAKSQDVILSAFYYKFFGDVLKEALEDHSQSGNYARLEKLADDHLTAHLKKARMLSFGPEPLFAYLYAKETEMRQIRVLITGKINRMPREAIRKRLRVCYI